MNLLLCFCSVVSASQLPIINKIPNATFPQLFTDLYNQIPLLSQIINLTKIWSHDTNDLLALGLDTVNQYSGYIDFDDKHLFYYFIESRNDPQTDPVILWLNGGPGSSTLTSMLFENGPVTLDNDLNTIHNPYSWNNNASVIYLDQPAGVGFSYGASNVTSTVQAAKDVHTFLQLFFEKYSNFALNDFHIGGYSYAGHYVPTIASEIVNNNSSINLKSIILGNPMTDPLIQERYYHPMVCGPDGGVGQLLDQDVCDSILKGSIRCEQYTSKCYESSDDEVCCVATEICGEVLIVPFARSGLNLFDVRVICEESTGYCYKGLKLAEQFLDLEHVKSALGSRLETFSFFNSTVYTNFLQSGDNSKPSQRYITELLENGIPVLIYAGDKDYICNWLGNLGWTNELAWGNESDQYRNQKLLPYELQNQQVGEFKSHDGLTFVRIYDAGHIAVHDQPETLLALVNSWVNESFPRIANELEQ